MLRPGQLQDAQKLQSDTMTCLDRAIDRINQDPFRGIVPCRPLNRSD